MKQFRIIWSDEETVTEIMAGLPDEARSLAEAGWQDEGVIEVISLGSLFWNELEVGKHYRFETAGWMMVAQVLSISATELVALVPDMGKITIQRMKKPVVTPLPEDRHGKQNASHLANVRIRFRHAGAETTCYRNRVLQWPWTFQVDARLCDLINAVGFPVYGWEATHLTGQAAFKDVELATMLVKAGFRVQVRHHDGREWQLIRATSHAGDWDEEEEVYWYEAQLDDETVLLWQLTEKRGVIAQQT